MKTQCVIPITNKQ
ncbi:hypothetical protein F383_19592 [Gossypium arboreum]|uniref:Uncharacterized protein n=1 Tax=Gossypium arboreum TaxID=29729 RepID=A0A0B0NN06_GOSAR|nr:hypothetical protein F383_19592 [Gossypium arboreum]